MAGSCTVGAAGVGITWHIAGTKESPRILLLSSNVPHFIIFPAQFCMSKKYMNHKGSYF